MAEKNASLVGHLGELRKRLMLIAFFFVIAIAGSFFFVRPIYQFMTKDLTEKLVVLGPADFVWIYFTLAFVIATAVMIPVIAWQIWLFVSPALKEKERKTALLYIPALFILFIAGICFGYFGILPFLLKFLKEFSEGMVIATYTVDKYFSFILRITVPFGFLFEMPLVMMFLTSIRVLNPHVISKIRKYCYFVLVIIAILLTPPDFFAQTIVSIPLIILFEISVVISKIVYKRQQKRDAQDAAALAADTIGSEEEK